MTADFLGEEQANVSPRLTDLSIRFWILLIATGISAGLGAIVMMWVLRSVQHLALNYHTGEYSRAAAHVSHLWLIMVLFVGGLVTGLGLWILRGHGGTGGEPTDVVWNRRGKLLLMRTLLSGALSEITVALGGSVGREAAPQRTGAAAADRLAQYFKLTPVERRVLIACGAGAGLSAVYNVPLAGALFTLEIYLGEISISMALPALLSSAIATATAWITLPRHAVYSIPTLPAASISLIAFALAVGPVIGIISAGYVKMIAWASDHQPKRWLLILEPVIAFTLLGIVATQYPLLLGNGVDLAQFAFVGTAAIFTLLALTVLKPLATALCFRSGATGGLFTPTLSFGAILGTLLGHLWSLYWPGAPMASYSVVSAGAMLGAAAEAPLVGAAFILELTRTSAGAMVPILIAVAGATLSSRHIDMRSIYTARLTSTIAKTDKKPTQPRQAGQ